MTESDEWVHKTLLPKMMDFVPEFSQCVVVKCEVDALPINEINWASRIYFISLTLAEHNIQETKYNLIVKRSIEKPEPYNKNQFINEGLFYGKFLKIFDEFAVKSKVSFLASSIFPKYFISLPQVEDVESINSEQVVVLENLKTFGYRLGNKECLDYNHIALALTELGRYHAFSYSLKIKNWEYFNKEIVNKVQDLPIEGLSQNEWVELSLRTVRSAVNYFENKDEIFYCKYKDKLATLRKYTDNLFKMMLKHCVPEEPLAVLCHGDFLRNNVMYNYENENSNKPLGIAFIDMQTIRYASPAIDVSVFLFCCATPKLRKERWDDFLHIYHDSMTRSLAQLLGCNVNDLSGDYSFHNFEKEMFSHGAYGYYISLYFLPWILFPTNEINEAIADPSGKEWDKILKRDELLKTQFANTQQIMEKFTL